jgi:hypothetical protein
LAVHFTGVSARTWQVYDLRFMMREADWAVRDATCGVYGWKILQGTRVLSLRCMALPMQYFEYSVMGGSLCNASVKASGVSDDAGCCCISG